jgi:hypothetical protein
MNKEENERNIGIIIGVISSLIGSATGILLFHLLMK